MKDVIARFTPPPPPGRLDPTDAVAARACSRRSRTRGGPRPRARLRRSLGVRVRDEEALARGMMSAGGFGAIAGAEQQDAAREAIVEALAVCRTPDGGYRLENEWHYLIARAAG